MGGLAFDATLFLVLFARVGAVLVLLPAFSEDAVPARIRVLLGLGLAAGLFGPLSARIAPAIEPGGALAGTIGAELLVGLSIGAIIRILFSAASTAGAIVSYQIGLASVLIFDPATAGQSPLLARFVGVAAVVVCMAAGGHHLWISSMVASYGLFPVGGLPPAADFVQLAVTTTSYAMMLALGLAAPLLVYGMLFNVALGLISRMTPTIQVFFIAQPLSLLLGLALFAVVIGTTLTTFAEATAGFLQNGWAG